MARDEAYVLDMLLAARRAVEGLSDADLQTFSQSWKIQSVVVHQLLILGEAAKRVSPEFRSRYPHIPWRSVAGQRDVLIHNYDAHDLPTIWNVVKQELPHLIESLESIIPECDKEAD